MTINEPNEPARTPIPGDPDYNPYSQQIEIRSDQNWTPGQPKRKYKILWLPTILISITVSVIATGILNLILFTG